MAFLAVACAIVEAPVGNEELRHDVRVNPGSGVKHLNLRSLRMHAHAHQHTARIGISNRIRHEVIDYRLEHLSVGADYAARGAEPQVESFCGGLRCELCPAGTQKIVDPGPSDNRPHLTGLEP